MKIDRISKIRSSIAVCYYEGDCFLPIKSRKELAMDISLLNGVLEVNWSHVHGKILDITYTFQSKQQEKILLKKINEMVDDMMHYHRKNQK